eukprot:scaffold33801_cov39-Tisochrysis_lutea.AAC.1
MDWTGQQEWGSNADMGQHRKNFLRIPPHRGLASNTTARNGALKEPRAKGALSCPSPCLQSLGVRAMNVHALLDGPAERIGAPRWTSKSRPPLRFP